MMMTKNESPQERADREWKEREQEAQAIIARRSEIAANRAREDAILEARVKREKSEQNLLIRRAGAIKEEVKENTVKVMAEGIERAKQNPPREVLRPEASALGYFLNLPRKTKTAEDDLIIIINNCLLRFSPGQVLRLEENDDGYEVVSQQVLDTLFTEGVPIVPIESREHLIQLRGSL